ncbi:hypothetical protein AX16_001189 [Volvariella volvacea WC 439]|nr:hypothetical protein AX16_001189 [Volvariella volvacea WC 439]
MQAKGPRIFEIGGTPETFGFSNEVIPVEQVRQEVEKLDEIIQYHPRQENVVVHGPSGTRVLKWMPKILACYIELEPLFKFTIFVDVSYVPKDLVNPVIRLLKVFLRLIKKIPPKSLELVEALSPVEGFTTFLPMIAGIKLARHLLNPDIGRPEEATPFFKESMDAYIESYKQNKPKDKPWIVNPAKWALEKPLEGFDVDDDPVGGEIFHQFRVHANLALVLKELGINEPVHER